MKTVPIFEHPSLGSAVSGRAVYNAIALERSTGSRDIFSDWFRSRQKKLQLVEDIDFVTLRTNTGYVSEANRQMIVFV